MKERRHRQTSGSPCRRTDDLAWVAGLVDGEATVGLNGGSAVIKIDMAYRPCLERVARTLGGEVNPNSGGRGSVKPIHRWALCGANAREALRRLLPHLVEKADQAALVLSVELGTPGRRLTENQLLSRRAIQQELSRLRRQTWR